MMAGNPNWWSSMHPPSLFSSQYLQLPIGSSTTNSSSLVHLNNSLPDDHHNLDPPQSWSQLLLGGLTGQEDESFGSVNHFQPKSRLENWEEEQQEQMLINPQFALIKPEENNLQNNGINLCSPHGRGGGGGDEDQFQLGPSRSSTTNWSPVHQVNLPVSSPRSCVTSLGNNNNNNNNMLDFSYNKTDNKRSQHADHSSECNSSTSRGGMCKKARAHPSPSQPPLKVRKEKLGDRITSLHQLVSPFGKTDTASVLLEAIGYIRFLQGQIEALSSPYLGNIASTTTRSQQPASNDNCLKRKGAPNQDSSQDHQHHKVKDLTSKGLCLVPVSCTEHVGSDNGADYWAPAYGSGF